MTRRALAENSAAAAIGPIRPGLEVFVLTGGAFSLVDAVVHVLRAIGPADVVISTWTAATADIGFARALLSEGNIRSLRFLVDFSFPSRQPAYCAALVEAFGPDCIRVSKNHAKFVLLRNDRFNVVMRTSMNLNENRRLETLELSDDAGLAEFLSNFIDQVFAVQGADDVKKRPGQHVEAFARLSGQEVTSKSTDVASLAKVMGDGVFSTDVRRAGLSFVR